MQRERDDRLPGAVAVAVAVATGASWLWLLDSSVAPDGLARLLEPLSELEALGDPILSSSMVVTPGGSSTRFPAVAAAVLWGT